MSEKEVRVKASVYFCKLLEFLPAKSYTLSAIGWWQVFILDPDIYLMRKMAGKHPTIITAVLLRGKLWGGEWDSGEMIQGRGDSKTARSVPKMREDRRYLHPLDQTVH